MKFLSLIGATLIVSVLSGCHPVKAHVPHGHTLCQKDEDCNEDAGEYCGFIGVDTYPVCRK